MTLGLRQKTPCRASSLASVACFLLAGVPLGLLARAGQESPASGVPLVRVDAVVTDRRGHAIGDLGVSDFEVLEGGTSRPIRMAQFRGNPRHSPVAVLPIVTESDEQRAAAEPGTRVFAFFVDEFHVSPGANIARVRDAIASFVEEKLFARDLAAVMTPLDSATSLRFTRDRALVHGPIANLLGRKGDSAPRTAFEAQHLGRDPVRVIPARRQFTGARLRELAMRLGDLKAQRAVIVLVSEGFSSEDGVGPDGPASDIEAVARAASRFHLTIYAFNPAAPHESAAIADRERPAAMLTRLATATGGLVVHPEAFIAGFARVYHDTEAYYALAYEPLHDDGAFHEVQVRARRRDVQLRTHAGYWSTNHALWRESVARPPVIPSPGPPLRRSPLIDRWVGVRHGPNGNYEMVVVWEPRARASAAPAVVLLNARTETGALVFDARLAAAGAAHAGERDHARFGVRPGRVLVDLSVRSAEGTVLDTDSSHIDVPDLRPSAQRGPVLLAPEIVRRRTLRDFQKASIDPEATPSALRTFTRGDRVLIRVGAFDATGIPVGVTARLLSRAGRPIRELEAVDSLRVVGLTQFALPLSWLPSEKYEIEVLGTNVNGSVRERIAFRLD